MLPPGLHFPKGWVLPLLGLPPPAAPPPSPPGPPSSTPCPPTPRPSPGPPSGAPRGSTDFSPPISAGSPPLDTPALVLLLLLFLFVSPGHALGRAQAPRRLMDLQVHRSLRPSVHHLRSFTSTERPPVGAGGGRNSGRESHLSPRRLPCGEGRLLRGRCYPTTTTGPWARPHLPLLLWSLLPWGQAELEGRKDNARNF